MVARSQESSTLRGAIWHEQHYSNNDDANESNDEMRTAPKGNIPFASRPREDDPSSIQSYTSKTGIPGQGMTGQGMIGTGAIPRPPSKFYPNIDLSIPLDVYDPSGGIDVVWDLLRYEAWVECQREPLLVSFLYSSILNHPSLESSLAFILANKLASPAMISTQVQSLISDVLSAAALTSASSSMSEDEIIDDNINIGRAVRADIMAVRDRDPGMSCECDGE
jgi:serine O-acetyltransferase